jgi:hypothetical protein
MDPLRCAAFQCPKICLQVFKKLTKFGEITFFILKLSEKKLNKVTLGSNKLINAKFGDGKNITNLPPMLQSI